MLLPNKDAIFQDDDSCIHTARSVQSYFEQHGDVLQHLLWLAQSTNLNIMEPLWSVLESRVRSRFPPSSVKQLEEKWYSIPLERLQNLHESIPRRIKAVTGKQWPNSILIKQCISFTAVFIIFVHSLYMLPT